MNPPFSSELLSRLSDWATEEFGLRFPPDRWSELARGIASAALELGIADLAGWAEGLVTGHPPSEQIAAIANHLTISETYFFRQHETFALLENDILPARLARRREQNRPLRIWSAGCASGEEPFSIAILIRHRFPDWPADRVSVVGSDINRHVLARAERATYSEWSFRDTPEWVRTGYFHRLPNGRLQVKPEIRALVRFVPLNFAAPLYPAELGERGDFDVVLCRNVLMYFSAGWQERIIRRLVQALAPGGWLLVSPCDVTGAQAESLGLRMAGPGTFQLGASAAGRTIPHLAPAPSSVAPVATAEFVAPPAAAPTPVLVPPPPATVQPEVLAASTPGALASARAQSHADRGELDEALAACEQAITSERTNPGYHYLRACILQEQNRLAEAAEEFRRVLFLEPKSVMAHFALGSIADRQGRREEARHHFKLVLRMLGGRNLGESVPGTEGLTVGRLQAVVKTNLADDDAA